MQKSSLPFLVLQTFGNPVEKNVYFMVCVLPTLYSENHEDDIKQ